MWRWRNPGGSKSNRAVWRLAFKFGVQNGVCIILPRSIWVQFYLSWCPFGHWAVTCHNGTKRCSRATPSQTQAWALVTLVWPNLYCLWSTSREARSFSEAFLLSTNLSSGMACGFRMRYLLENILHTLHDAAEGVIVFVPRNMRRCLWGSVQQVDMRGLSLTAVWSQRRWCGWGSPSCRYGCPPGLRCSVAGAEPGRSPWSLQATGCHASTLRQLVSLSTLYSTSFCLLL